MSDYETVRSPLNYTGSKYRYIDLLLDLMPEKIRIFADWFAGGGNVFANVWPNRSVLHVHVSDNDAGLMALLVAMGYQDPLQFIRDVEAVAKENNLNRANKEAYYTFREKVNTKEIPIKPESFMALVAHSYNNMIRWNKNGDFNVPFGKRYFNPNMKDNTFAFINRLNRIPNLTYFARDFRRLRTRHLVPEDLVFCDPPYLIGSAAYNMGWTEKDEKDLLCKLDIVNMRGSRFMLINALEHKGQENHLLEEWMQDFRVVDVMGNYTESYQATRKTKGKTREVIVMNYE